MNDLQIFTNDQFGKIRSMVIDGAPWFAGKDVSSALGYSNPQKAIRDHVDTEDQAVNEVFTPGGKQKTVFINESGLYSLILQSKLPSAKDFKRWVTGTVLPMIRQTGIYAAGLELANGDSVTPMRTLTPDDYLAAARLIASCKDKRLKIVLGLLAKGGWEVENLQDTPPAAVSTADIGPRLKEVRKKYGIRADELAAKMGIDYGVYRSYETGHRFPRPNRYGVMIAVLNAIEESHARDQEGPG